ncbi:helix-turn-helix transcriptional regulator [Deinococcus sp. KSM4-11]|uniref:helix-turn-helix domain-containing protein n=1 Tax=Deinococcus sp. KSM4-11 TaxID=2568654 RepID=UPI0010A379A8|nr:helix-turn-helix transcriptional regulator [Deinococcus sp. KSM4-11]THF87207.1 helix-turn-helix transcriptional regulator [Deinococcus sp. KSM4-11]
MQAQWKLRDYLHAHGITPYKLAKAIPDVRQATIYRLAAEDAPQSVSFDILSRVITGLRTVTGQDVTVGDLITLVEIPTSEDAAWMNADLSGMADLDPYDWGNVDPLSLGEAVSVSSDGQIIVGKL